MKLLSKLTHEATKLCFIDLESTQTEHETIAIGAVLSYVGADGMPKPPFKEFKSLVKSRHKVGGIVSELTGITDDMLSKSPTFEETIKALINFIKDGSDSYGNVRFVCYGNQDRKMMKVSTELSKDPEIKSFNDFFTCNYVDFDRFISNYIKDKNNNTLSLKNFLKLFDVDGYGHNHDPLSDAYDLLHLYIAFHDNKELVKKMYVEKLLRDMDVPTVLKPIFVKVLTNKKVRRRDFERDLEEYFE